MVVIPRDILANMVDHARRDAPIEACGLLAGVWEYGSVGVWECGSVGELNVERRTSNVERRTSDIRYRASSIEHRASRVEKSYRLTNVDGSAEHFSLDPKEQFAAVKDARASGFEILAVYHSHPSTPARMSDEDLRLAFAPGIQFAIISLSDPERPVVKSFRVQDGRPVEEEVLIQEFS